MTEADKTKRFGYAHLQITLAEQLGCVNLGDGLGTDFQAWIAGERVNLFTVKDGRGQEMALMLVSEPASLTDSAAWVLWAHDKAGIARVAHVFHGRLPWWVTLVVKLRIVRAI